MTINRVPGEYRMISADGTIELTIERTDRDGIRYFRLSGPLASISFTASLSFGGRPKWTVLRIVISGVGVEESSVGESTQVFTDLARDMIMKALQDFGTFFGERSGEIEVVFNDRA